MTNFSWSSAWWVNNAVADQVYTRSDRAAPVVLAARKELEASMETALATCEAQAKAQFEAGHFAAGQAILNAHAVEMGATATVAWTALWQRLTMLFYDGKTTTLDPTNEVCGCDRPSAVFTDAWAQKVVQDDGDHYRVPNQKSLAGRPHDKPTRDKLSIRGVAP